MPGLGAVLAVGVGAAIGAWCRWGLAIALNPRSMSYPLGTIAANLIGGYMVGIAIAFFAARQGLAPEVRLFVITGFLGGLTTFSTFSAEVTHVVLRGDYVAALALATIHLIGSIALTFAGIATFRALA